MKKEVQGPRIEKLIPLPGHTFEFTCSVCHRTISCEQGIAFDGKVYCDTCWPPQDELPLREPPKTQPE